MEMGKAKEQRDECEIRVDELIEEIQGYNSSDKLIARMVKLRPCRTSGLVPMCWRTIDREHEPDRQGTSFRSLREWTCIGCISMPDVAYTVVQRSIRRRLGRIIGEKMISEYPWHCDSAHLAAVRSSSAFTALPSDSTNRSD
jgi:hypothetical protein